MENKNIDFKKMVSELSFPALKKLEHLISSELKNRAHVKDPINEERRKWFFYFKKGEYKEKAYEILIQSQQQGIFINNFVLYSDENGDLYVGCKQEITNDHYISPIEFDKREVQEITEENLFEDNGYYLKPYRFQFDLLEDGLTLVNEEWLVKKLNYFINKQIKS